MMFDKKYDDLDECVFDTLKLCTEYAKNGIENGIGGPFGAAIIQKIDDKYKILVIARNTVLMEKDPTCHAEINAIKKASRILERFELDDCILVSTSKSCPMCLSAACWARIPVIKYVYDYEHAEKYGFIDKKVMQYIKGKNTIIKEEKVKCEIPDLFIDWDDKKDKTNY